MTMFLLLLVLTMAAVACVKAYYAATLATKDPEASPAGTRPTTNGDVTGGRCSAKRLVGGVNIIRGWFRKQTD